MLGSVRDRTVLKEPSGERIRANPKHSGAQTVTGIPQWKEGEGPYLDTEYGKLGKLLEEGGVETGVRSWLVTLMCEFSKY